MYVDLKYDDLTLLVLMVVCEWVGGVKGLMRSKNTSGCLSFYVDNISLKTYSTWNFSKIPTKSY